MTQVTVSLPYGSGEKRIQVPEANLLDIIYPKAPEGAYDEGRLLAEAMAHPIGSPPLREMVHPGQVVAIVASDLTRPCPSEKLLPLIMAELQAAQIPDQDIFIVVGLGLHRPMTEAELRQAFSAEIQKRYKIFNHDPEDTVSLGFTTRGTPVEFFRPLVEADMRICLGNIEFHYFAGFSGGAKAILPGCSSRATVTANHAMMVLPEASTGRLDGNPLREDIDEAVAMLGVDFILNVVVNEHHQISGAFAGELMAAHRRGCEMVLDRGKVAIRQKADIVIASAGGMPKDINFYQSHKAMEGARDFVADSGILIVVGECREGFGNRTFEEWMLSGNSPQELITRIQRSFVLGGHKAAAIAAILQRVKVYLVSEMPDETVRRCGFTPFHDVQQALERALEELGEDSTVMVIPQAISVLPELI